MNLAGQNSVATGAINQRISIRGLLVAGAIGILFITAVFAWTSINASPIGGAVEKASPAGLLLDPGVIEHLRREHANGAVGASATGSRFDRSLLEHRRREYGSANGAASNSSAAELLLDPAVIEHLQRERAN